jgi:hypothetical protein
VIALTQPAHFAARLISSPTSLPARQYAAAAELAASILSNAATISDSFIDFTLARAEHMVTKSIYSTAEERTPNEKSALVLSRIELKRHRQIRAVN